MVDPVSSTEVRPVPEPPDLTNWEVVDAISRLIAGDDAAWLPWVRVPDNSEYGLCPGRTWRFDASRLLSPPNYLALTLHVIDQRTVEMVWEVNGQSGPRRRMQIFAKP